MQKPSIVFLATLLPACLVPLPPDLVGEGSTSGPPSASADASSGNETTQTGETSSPDADTTGGEDDPSSSDDPTEGSASSGSFEDGSTSDAPCDGQCVGIPDGWQGPVVAHAWSTGESPIACEGDYAELVGQYSNDFFAQPAECDCACGNVTGAQCTPPTLRHSNVNCQAIGAPMTLNAGCNNIAGITNGSFTLIGSTFSGGQCQGLLSKEVPDAGFAEDVVLCGATPDATGCAEGELCGPDTDAPLCVWAEGEQSCPDGFDDRSLLYSGFVDTRDCTACTCGAPEGTCTTGHATLADNTCGAVVTQIVQVQPGTCQDFNGTARSIVMPNTPNPVASCEPSDVSPIGGATPTVAATLCCASPA